MILSSSWMTATTLSLTITGAQIMDSGRHSPSLPHHRGSLVTSGMLASSLWWYTHPAMDDFSSLGIRRIWFSPWAIELQSSSFSSSTIHSVARAQPRTLRPSSMTVFMMVFNSSARLARSAAWRSTTNKLHIPMRQPTMTPQTLPKVDTRFTMPKRCCASVKPGSGRPSFRASASMVPPKRTPDVSLKICPHAAAPSVGRPSDTPSVASMASPA
mmetsp:Transcript_49344/g.130071  ORF Transcript_49344/g.130071 Transcript_49344/m.130071 type:complete len:214 (-) Transcript_49344:283-924(-)